jgi:hypothetical protein
VTVGRAEASSDVGGVALATPANQRTSCEVGVIVAEQLVRLRNVLVCAAGSLPDERAGTTSGPKVCRSMGATARAPNRQGRER